jgi:hypothetical protein
MFERIELNEQQAAVWRGITQEQKNIITILAQNYDEVNNDDDWTFVDAMSVDDVDAATYTTVLQYPTWRSITLQQKQLVVWVWDMFTERYNNLLTEKYDQQEVYNLDLSYSMFTVYAMFANQDQLGTINDFRFLTNRNI